MKKKYNEWLSIWVGFQIAFIILAILSHWNPFPWVYAGPVLNSVALAFGVSCLIFGIIFMVYRHKYLKELDKKYKL